MKLEKNTKRLIALATIALIAFAAIVYAVIVWEYTTQITVREPFEVQTDLPETISLYPGGPYNYWINITNHGGETLNATLYYTVTTTNCTVEISPANGTSYKVEACDGIASIPVSITISVDGYSANGTATIDWWIERTSP
jgi:hypothetical protein